MPSFEEECLRQLGEKELLPACDELPNPGQYHCLDLLNMNPKMHKQCEGVAPYFPIPTLACIHKTNGKPDKWEYFPPETRIKECIALGVENGWNLEECYCCCSCFAYGTPVATSQSTQRLVETLLPGESVLAGWHLAASDSVEWKSIPLVFSQGIPKETAQVTVYLVVGDGESTDDLICSIDQPLMLSSGKLTTAGKLRRGDALMRLDGTTTNVHTIAIGEYTGGLHHIGTNMPQLDAEGKPIVDGHLIGVANLVAGDYFLQIFFPSLDPSQVAEDHEDRPELGTPQYAEANEESRSKIGMLFGEFEEKGEIQVQSGRFSVYRGHGALDGPFASLLTEQQAQDVLENGQFMNLSQTLPKGLVENIFKQLAGFFPNVDFYLDWLEMEPNVHALKRYGKEFVVITGGLARLVHFNYEGILFAIGAGLGRLAEEKPYGEYGFSGTGIADMWAFNVLRATLLVGIGSVETSLKGLKQFEALFALVNPEHAEGNPDDPVDEPSLSCRVKCIQSAIASGPVPPCAGGPEPPLVALNWVEATPTSARLQLSTPPTHASAEDPSHYTLSPGATITAAKVSKDTNLVVELDVELESGGKYELTISGIESMEGAGVDPEANSVEFEVSGEKE